MSAPAQRTRLVRRTEVEDRTGLTKSTLYDLVGKGEFPAPVKLTQQTVAWIDSEVEGWIQERIEGERVTLSAR